MPTRAATQVPSDGLPAVHAVARLRFRGLHGEAAFAALVARASEVGPAAALSEASGSFAICWTDARGDTHMAVDRFAISTLCWRVVDGSLHCGARADDLADLAPAAAVDVQSLYEFLYLHVITSPRTIFAGVQRLPAAHLATWTQGQVTVRPYWVPTFPAPREPALQPLAQEFKGLLEQAVGRQLEAGDDRPACFLSGGTDSSTVAGFVRAVSGRAPRAYSIGFEAEGYDEMAYARIAARQFGCEHHEYYVTPADLVAGMPQLAAHFDQPFGNSSALPAYCCASRAREDGIEVILAGDGGDELFGGNSRYAKQTVFDLYQRVPAVARRLLDPLANTSAFSHVPLLRKMGSYVQQARLPMPARMDLYNLLLRIGPGQVLEPALLAQVDTNAPMAQQTEVWHQAATDSALNRNLAFDWRYTLAECDLPKVVGSTAMAGLEARFPFLDEDLVAFSMALPVDFKLKGQQLRWFFKQALSDFLPQEIIEKKKHGFGLPFGVWCLKDEALRRLATDCMASLARRQIVKPSFTQELMGRLLPAHPGYYGEMVWILCMLELWMQQRRPDYRVPG